MRLRWSLATSTTDLTETPMTKTNMDLSELLAKHDQGDFLRTIAETVLQMIMEADVEGLIGAGRHERSGERPGARVPRAAHRRGRRDPPGLRPTRPHESVRSSVYR